MNSTEVINNIYDKVVSSGITKKQILAILDAFKENIINCIQKKEPFTYYGFFHLSYKELQPQEITTVHGIIHVPERTKVKIKIAKKYELV